MYRFKSKATGDLITLKATGDQVLRIIGKEPAAQGIIPAATLPAAIAAIEHAVVAAEAAPANDAASARQVAVDPHDTEARDKVSLRQRAWPFLEMMKRAHAEDADIVWGV